MAIWARGDAQKDVRRFSHLCIANFSYRNTSGLFENNRFHTYHRAAAPSIANGSSLNAGSPIHSPRLLQYGAKAGRNRYA